MVTKSKEFLRNFSKLNLKTVIPQKSLILGTNSGEFLKICQGISYRNMILEKFLGNSSKKVTMVGESGKIPHFCYLDRVVSGAN